MALCHVLDGAAEEVLALTGKIPSDVRQTVRSSTTAQQVRCAAQQMALTDREWAPRRPVLRRLRAEARGGVRRREAGAVPRRAAAPDGQVWARAGAGLS